MSEITKKQYHNLNALKIIAAFFVVCIHIPFPGTVGRAVIAVARFAVPFFFMVSGFFSYYPDKSVLNEKYKRKIKHLLVIFSGSFLMYLAYDVLGSVLNGTLMGYLKGKFSAGAFFEFFVFNHVRVMEALWFLPALIYVTVAFFVFEKKGITKKMYVLIPLLFIFGVALREIPEFVADAPTIMSKAYFYRNWLFVGLPFFMLGHFIRVYEDKFKNKFTYLSLAIIMFVGTAQAVAVDLLHTQKSVYAGTFLAVFTLFVFALKTEGKVNVARLALLGANYSLYVYIFHIFVNNVAKKIGAMSFASGVFGIIKPILPVIIFALTLSASFVYVEMKKFFKSKLRKQEN